MKKRYLDFMANVMDVPIIAFHCCMWKCSAMDEKCQTYLQCEMCLFLNKNRDLHRANKTDWSASLSLPLSAKLCVCVCQNFTYSRAWAFHRIVNLHLCHLSAPWKAVSTQSIMLVWWTISGMNAPQNEFICYCIFLQLWILNKYSNSWTHLLIHSFRFVCKKKKNFTL